MLLVVCSETETLETIVTNLRPRTLRTVLGVDNAPAALRLVELNQIDTVLLDLRYCTRAWLRTFGARFPAARCIVLGGGSRQVGEARSFLPGTLLFIPSPIDWDELVTTIEKDPRSEGESGSLVAEGLEEALSLLEMTQANAKVQVLAGLKRGSLFLRGGTVVHAERGGRTGADVAYEIVGWLEPQVMTRSLDIGRDQETMKMSVADLLWESARRRTALSHFASTIEVQSVLERIADMPHFVGLTLLHVDNAQSLATRGREAPHLRPDIMRACVDTAKFWAPPAKDGTRPRGTVFWTEETVSVTVPLDWQIVLTVCGRDVRDFEAFRGSVVTGAQTLLELADHHLHGGSLEAANYLPW